MSIEENIYSIKDILESQKEGFASDADQDSKIRLSPAGIVPYKIITADDIEDTNPEVNQLLNKFIQPLDNDNASAIFESAQQAEAPGKAPCCSNATDENNRAESYSTRDESADSRIKPVQQPFIPKPTYSVYKDWDSLDKTLRGGNHYKYPTSYKHLNLFYPAKDQLNYEKAIMPYHEYYSYDPYDFAPIAGWKTESTRTWGNGKFNKYGYYLPIP